MDEAVEGIRAKGITVVGAVCHVSDAQQRKNLIETAVKVGIVEGGFISLLSGLIWLSSYLSRSTLVFFQSNSL